MNGGMLGGKMALVQKKLGGGKGGQLLQRAQAAGKFSGAKGQKRLAKARSIVGKFGR